LGLFDRIKQPASVQQLFSKALTAWMTKQHSQARLRVRSIEGQLDDVRRQQERLLNLHLAGAIDEQTFATKNVELRDRVATLTLQMEATDRKKDEKGDLALRVFELSQRLREKWITADFPVRRRLLNLVCLNFVLQGASLVITCRKPFNPLVEGLSVSESGEGEIRKRYPAIFRAQKGAVERFLPLFLPSIGVCKVTACSGPLPPVTSISRPWPFRSLKGRATAKLARYRNIGNNTPYGVSLR
jgi:hypothetical protein